jgi:hypothetical protein
MKATYNSNNTEHHLDSITEKDIATLLSNLDGWNNAYVIIENEKGDYMQTMGGDNGFVVEVRFQGEGKFKHFVVGYPEMSKVWHNIQGSSGPVPVLGHEVLQRSDVETLFKFFLTTSEVKSGYNKRNITKIFTSPA